MKSRELVKIAKKNVRYNREDYALYFITLTIAVSLFYILNTLMEWDILKNGRRDFVVTIGSGIIILLAAMIMGFLFVYMNRFMLKKRKREISIYMLLGMKHSEIESLLAMELKRITTVSFISGIAISSMIMWGIMQVIQMRTGLKNIGTICSPLALGKTILYVVLLHIFITYKNNTMLDKSSIRDIEDSSKANEDASSGRLFLKILLFFTSIGLLATGSKIGWVISDTLEWKQILAYAIAGIVGVFLFFATVFEAVTKLCYSIKHIYLRNYRLFLINQLRRNFHANHRSMSMVSLCLLVSIGSLFCSYYFVCSFQHTKQELSCYDASIHMNHMEQRQADEIYARLGNLLGETGNHSMFETALLNQEDIRLDGRTTFVLNDTIIPLSSYNSQMKLIGEEQIQLKNNEFAICSGFWQDSQSKELLEKEVTLYNNPMISGYEQLQKGNVYNGSEAANLLVLSNQEYRKIVQKNGIRRSYGINVILRNDEKKQVLQTYFEQLKEEYPGILLFEKTKVSEYVKMDMIVFYITLMCGYMGLIFLSAACTILTIHQITEVFESRKRYEILLNIGGKRNEIRKLLAKQIGIIFIVPFLLAAFFSVVILIGVFHDCYFVNLKGVIWTISIGFSAFYLMYYIATVHRANRLVFKKEK